MDPLTEGTLPYVMKVVLQRLFLECRGVGSLVNLGLLRGTMTFMSGILVFIRFIVVGSAGTLVQAGVLDYMTRVLGRWYMEGVIVGFLLSITIMFFIEKFWVFHDRTHDHTKKEFGLFCIASLSGLGETMVLMYILVGVFGIWPISAQIWTSLLVIATAYVFNSNVTFRKKS